MGRVVLLAVTLGLCSATDYWFKVTTDGNAEQPCVRGRKPACKKGKITGVTAMTLHDVHAANATACMPIKDDTSTETPLPDVNGTQRCSNGMNVNLNSGKNDMIMGANGGYKPAGYFGLAGPVVRVTGMTDGYSLEIEAARTKQCQSWINTPTVNLWATNTKAILYLFGLCWVFLGVAIVADVFMSSIEVITSEEVTVTINDENGNPKDVNVDRWNPTVANLTLMALGSSAPEILLAVLETMGSLKQTPGELGPSTIVGSAAYNLFVITGVCMISVPPADEENGESGVRDISELGVFYVTGFFSVFAYVWMLIVLMDGVCEVWEAFVTFLFFPLLVGLAYGQDIGIFFGKGQKATTELTDLEARVGSEEEMVLGRALVPKVVGSKNIKAFNDDIKNSISPQQLAEMKAFNEADEDDKAAFMNANADKIAAQMALTAPGLSKKKSKMFWRVQAGKNAKGKPSVFDELEKGKADKPESGTGAAKPKASSANVSYSGAKSDKAFEFNSAQYSVKEDAGHVTLHVHRNGQDIANTSSVCVYETLDGTAKAGDKDGGDYEASKGEVKFAKGERTKPIIIQIFHDKEVEDNETFYVQLKNKETKQVVDKAEITIIDVSSVGTFQMRHVEKRCNESCGVCKVWVDRIGGSDGEVDIMWQTEQADIGTNDVGKKVSATPCQGDGGEEDKGDYVPVQKGVLTFRQGEIIRPIEIKIKDNNVIGDADRVFSVTLNSAKLKDSVKDASDPPVNGDKSTCDVSIQDDDDHFKFVNLVQIKLQERMLKFSIATTSYKDQFLDAVEIDREHTSCITYLLHCMSLPWKVIMAFIPPTEYGGGWVTFITSLAATGIITAIVAELAGMFGCMVGLSDAAVALTVVALGTSLPDTFASILAIKYATDADAAVGNVTGSNSVNVFLGLGLPWVIASLVGGPDIIIPNGGSTVGKGFKMSCSTVGGCPASPYVVPTGSLFYSVTIFAPMAIVCLLSLLFNRMIIGGVVGGSTTYRSIWFCIYVSMWVGFLAAAIMGGSS